MKTTMQTTNSINWKARATLLTIGLILAGLSINARSASSPDAIPMCAKFVGTTALIRNDGHPTQMYCNSELDVIAASTGGFGFTTNDRKSARKAWIDLKSAVQPDNNPPVDESKLPQGEVEFTLHDLTHNNADGIKTDGMGGCLPPVTEVLGMAPGDFIITAPLIVFTDTTPTASKGQYALRFGQPVCEPGFSWEMSSDCPLKVTAGFDFNGNGVIEDSEAYLDADNLVDIWTIEPSKPEARARLLKVNKRQQFDSLGIFQIPFKLVFTKEQFGAVLDQITE